MQIAMTEPGWACAWELTPIPHWVDKNVCLFAFQTIDCGVDVKVQVGRTVPSRWRPPVLGSAPRPYPQPGGYPLGRKPPGRE